MNEKLYEALEVCLQAIETGADLESVLRRYPDLADELRPVLEAAFQARSLAAPSIPEAAMQRSRARVLQHAAILCESERSSQRPVLWFPRLAASLALALLFFVLGGTGLVRASGEALPGDSLYPVKRTLEDMRLLLVINPEGREELEDEFEQKRLYEINELLVEGRYETISFAGEVTEQYGNRWVVSGVSVQIMPESELPDEPITIGASVLLEGHTNAQGFVEAERVIILSPGIALPPSEPARGVDSNDNDRSDDSSSEQNDNENPDDLEQKDLHNDNDDNSNDRSDGNEKDNSSDSGEDSNSGPGSGGDNDNNNDSDDNSGSSDSGGGKDDNSNGDDSD